MTKQKRPIVLFQDNDQAGRALTKKMRDHFTVQVVHSPRADEDLDGFLTHHRNKAAKGLEELKALLKHPETVYLSKAAIREKLRPIRKQQLKDFEISEQVADCVIDSMTELGKFYKTATAPYFLDHSTGTLCTLNRSSTNARNLIHDVGINPTERPFHYTLSELEKVAREEGRATTTHLLNYFDKVSHTLYLFNRNSEVFRITPVSIDVIPNGTDGVLFEPFDDYTPFEQDNSITLEDDLLSSLITNDLHFEEDVLSARDYKALLETWVLSLFFTGQHGTKPIAAFIGAKGSGKTSTLRRLGMLLLGPSFQVSPMPEKPDDFDSVVTNGFLTGFDNVDGQVKYLNDKLALVATGGSIKKRELYSTNNLVNYPVRSHVAITSRTPKFRRDDVAERLLIFPFKVVEQKVSEQYLIDTTLQARNRFMSWLLLVLQDVIKQLEKTQETPIIQSELRMADFASFFIRLAIAHGNEQAAREVLAKLTRKQSQFTLEQDPLFTLLEMVANQTPVALYTAATLHQKLGELSRVTGNFYGYKSANSLGQKLGHLKTNIDQVLDMTVEKGRGNMTFYRFALKNPTSQDV